MIRVRFAPSPTGYLHIGNARIALLNWLFSKKQSGHFFLRYDDTDRERSTDEYVKAISDDLMWLGIRPDEIYFQSERFAHYDSFSESLKKAGLLYPCYETIEELEEQRTSFLSRALAPIYNRAALNLADEEKMLLERKGRKPHWRFLLPNFLKNPFDTERTYIEWDDMVWGRQKIDLSSVSDPIVMRADGSYLYTLTSIIDDIVMGITHIIRGADHITNTAVQIAIFRSLGAVLPNFAHVNLLTTVLGEGLSKRNKDLSVFALRKSGFENMSLISLAVLIGTSESVKVYKNMLDLLENFDMNFISKSSAKFNLEDLLHLNRRLVHNLEFSEVSGKLSKMGILGAKAEPFWLAIRQNLNTVLEAYEWWKIITDKSIKFSFFPNDDTFLDQAAFLLPEEPWKKDTLRVWTDGLKEKTSRKKQDIFKHLRIALTGKESGPELADVLPLMDRNLVLFRLRGKIGASIF
ncbi:MAG: glutamyl-tRNA synthetase [Candidatus Tokpelaia sp. JSC161]|jgi:glutamyl-tRNA synthetase|nr:MAG: glutamyl-tRNA synthetase [Candidatus Tokpelaia sp. JSC161]